MSFELFRPSNLALLFANVFSRPQPQKFVVPACRNENATAVTQYTSGRDGFDAPKVHPINATTYDWWWFDAIQQPVPTEDGGQSQAHIVITFYNLGSEVLTEQFPKRLAEW